MERYKVNHSHLGDESLENLAFSASPILLQPLLSLEVAVVVCKVDEVKEAGLSVTEPRRKPLGLAKKMKWKERSLYRGSNCSGVDV